MNFVSNSSIANDHIKYTQPQVTFDPNESNSSIANDHIKYTQSQVTFDLNE